jgi:hypothetical protein
MRILKYWYKICFRGTISRGIGVTSIQNMPRSTKRELQDGVQEGQYDFGWATDCPVKHTGHHSRTLRPISTIRYRQRQPLGPPGSCLDQACRKDETPSGP